MANKMGRPTGCISTGEAAVLAGVTKQCVVYWINNGRFPAAQDPNNGYYWIRKKDFEACVKKMQDPKRLKFTTAKPKPKKHSNNAKKR